MDHLDHTALSREIIEDRIREANQLRLVRECRRRGRASAAQPAGESAQRHFRLWSLLHFRQSYS